MREYHSAVCLIVGLLETLKGALEVPKTEDVFERLMEIVH